jgi:hypothetical protein
MTYHLATPFDNQSITWKTKTTVQGPMVVQPIANNVQRLRTKEQLCDYLHRAAGHPVKKTWLAAIKGGEYTTWPGFTNELVANHLYDTEETAMGHLHKKEDKILWSTKPKPVQAKNKRTRRTTSKPNSISPNTCQSPKKSPNTCRFPISAPQRHARLK